MDLERIARDLLRDSGIPCEFYVPEKIPERLVTVKRTATPGSTRFLGRAMLTLQAWATTRGAAMELCEAAMGTLVMNMADTTDVTGCSPENGPYRWDDPDVKDRCRWQATVSVNYND